MSCTTRCAPGRLMNFVGIMERSDWQVESWNTQGTADECARDFIGWHRDIQEMIAASPTLFKWALMGRDPLPQWTRGRITLLGDACHSTLPMLAQGAVMALEDAVILGRCFDKYGDVADRARALRAGAPRRHHPQGQAAPTTMRCAFTTRRSPPRRARRPMSTANGAARRSSSATSGFSPTMSKPRRFDAPSAGDAR